MSAPRKTGALLAFLAVSVWPIPLPAATVEFEMGGVISDTTSYTHSPIAGFAVGDPWRVRTTFAGEPADPVLGSTSTFQLAYYELVTPGLSLTIQPLQVFADRQTITLTIDRNYPSGNVLQFWAHNTRYFGNTPQSALPIAPTVLVDGRKLWYSFVAMNQYPPDMWTLNAFSNALDFGLEDFAEKRFVITLYDDRAQSTYFDSVMGTVDYYRATVVPVPGTLGLLASAIAALGGHRRRGNETPVRVDPRHTEGNRDD